MKNVQLTSIGNFYLPDKANSLFLPLDTLTDHQKSQFDVTENGSHLREATARSTLQEAESSKPRRVAVLNA